ncbi:hypothetical protein [Arthrobacter sp. B2a2-09]|uniref:hypothetical protein n=1 Tax=Arthrobacter sp. B2a2-09 TaxID=2952822 RepID=UPI0022CD668F|nr:hypothetical protein [Arthrobacter sp. B2a2-09]MCZ9880454.1 hypothetical protein [Arthrobacter sp. B2a2-09]
MERRLQLNDENDWLGQTVSVVAEYENTGVPNASAGGCVPRSRSARGAAEQLLGCSPSSVIVSALWAMAVWVS